MARFVLTVHAADRPGLNRAIADAVLAAGGNWLESRLSRLGGRYLGAVLVELGEDRQETLLGAVRDIGPADLEVQVLPEARAPDPGGPAVSLSLVGQDRPGIVQRVSAVLGALHVNIEELVTRTEEEAWAGTLLFRAEAQLRLPAGLGEDVLRAALEEISGEVMVDLATRTAPA